MEVDTNEPVPKALRMVNGGVRADGQGYYPHAGAGGEYLPVEGTFAGPTDLAFLSGAEDIDPLL